MPTSTMFRHSLLLCLSLDVIGVRGQPTTDQCHSDDNDDRQVALLEQTLQAFNALTGRVQSIESELNSMNALTGQLQSMKSILVSIENRLNSIESWKESFDIWMKICSRGILSYSFQFS